MSKDGTGTGDQAGASDTRGKEIVNERLLVKRWTEDNGIVTVGMVIVGIRVQISKRDDTRGKATGRWFGGIRRGGAVTSGQELVWGREPWREWTGKGVSPGTWREHGPDDWGVDENDEHHEQSLPGPSVSRQEWCEAPSQVGQGRKRGIQGDGT